MTTATQERHPLTRDGALDGDYYERLTMRVFGIVDGPRQDEKEPTFEDVKPTLKEVFEALQQAHHAATMDVGVMARTLMRQLRERSTDADHDLSAEDLTALDELYRMLRSADPWDNGTLNVRVVFDEDGDREAAQAV